MLYLLYLLRLIDEIPNPIEIDDDQCVFIESQDDEEIEIGSQKNKINNADLEENKLEIEEVFEEYEISDIDARNELQDLMSKSTGDCTVKSFTIRWTWSKLNAFINQTYGSNKNLDGLAENLSNGSKTQILNNSKNNDESKPVDVLWGIWKKSLK